MTQFHGIITIDFVDGGPRSHFHQELVGCPRLGTMIEVASKHGVFIRGVTSGIWPWVKSMFNRRRVLVGVSAYHADLSDFWDEVKASLL